MPDWKTNVSNAVSKYSTCVCVWFGKSMPGRFRQEHGRCHSLWTQISNRHCKKPKHCKAETNTDRCIGRHHLVAGYLDGMYVCGKSGVQLRCGGKKNVQLCWLTTKEAAGMFYFLWGGICDRAGTRVGWWAQTVLPQETINKLKKSKLAHKQENQRWPVVFNNDI
jgi:hypothetical protein